MISRGIGIVAKGMQALIDFEDVTAHNLANVTTDGFKRSHITFQDVMQSQVQEKNAKGVNENVGTLSVGARTVRTYIDFSQGGLAETGKKLDIAFQGDGFFKIRHREIKDTDPDFENNYYYQRTGSFKLDDENYLINSDGDYVMDMRNRRIRISRNLDEDDVNEMNRFDLTQDIMIAENGQIELNGQDYRVTLQKIQICDFQDKTKVSCIGQAKYLPIYGEDAGIYTKTDGTFSLQQGFSEKSNASTIVEMLNTINVSRGYETMSTMMKTQSDTLSQAINLGNVSA